MIRSALRYHDPATVTDACALLAEHGADAAVLGGGTLLVPMMTRGERRPDHLVDLRHLGLGDITEDGGTVRIGARVTYADVSASALLRERVPLLVEMADGITGGAQVRNLATLGGSACYANPASDVPGCLVARGAAMEVHGPDGSREVPAAEFFVDAFTTALGADELLGAFSVPAASGPHGYHKLKLCEGSWPIATAAALTSPAGAVAVTVGGVCATPIRVELDGATDDAGDRILAQLREPWTDELATGDYRRAIAGVIAQRALTAMTEGHR
jgi:carbon-monoxide dehydrogenase medium subunit